MNDSAARMYAGYNALQAMLGSDLRLSTPAQQAPQDATWYLEDDELEELVQSVGYDNYADYRAAQDVLRDDLEAQEGQY